MRGVVAAWPGDAAHEIRMVIFAVIRIALDDSNGDDKGRIYYVVYVL